MVRTPQLLVTQAGAVGLRSGTQWLARSVEQRHPGQVQRRWRTDVVEAPSHRRSGPRRPELHLRGPGAAHGPHPGHRVLFPSRIRADGVSVLVGGHASLSEASRSGEPPGHTAGVRGARHLAELRRPQRRRRPHLVADGRCDGDGQAAGPGVELHSRPRRRHPTCRGTAPRTSCGPVQQPGVRPRTEPRRPTSHSPTRSSATTWARPGLAANSHRAARDEHHPGSQRVASSRASRAGGC